MVCRIRLPIGSANAQVAHVQWFFADSVVTLTAQDDPHAFGMLASSPSVSWPYTLSSPREKQEPGRSSLSPFLMHWGSQEASGPA